MAKKCYVGVNNLAQNCSNIYVGVNNVARKVVKGYVGVNGVAQQFWGSETEWRQEADVPYGTGNNSAVVFQNKIHLLGGAYSAKTNHYSWDGTTWREESVMPFNFTNGSAITFDGKIHCFLGTGHYTWDGTSWTQESALPYPVDIQGNNHAVILNGKLTLVGSNWTSYGLWKHVATLNNGTWSVQQNVLDPDSPYLSSVAYNDVAYILGDNQNQGLYYRVWTGSSLLAKQTLPFLFQEGYALVYNGCIHILGGRQAGTQKHYAFDGTSWIARADVPYYGFQDCPAVVYNNRIHIFGNNTGTGTQHWSYGKEEFTMVYNNGVFYNSPSGTAIDNIAPVPPATYGDYTPAPWNTLAQYYYTNKSICLYFNGDTSYRYIQSNGNITFDHNAPYGQNYSIYIPVEQTHANTLHVIARADITTRLYFYGCYVNYLDNRLTSAGTSGLKNLTSSFVEYTATLDTTKHVNYVQLLVEQGTPIIQKIWFTNN